MIADILSVSIDEIRATKDNQFFYEFYMPPSNVFINLDNLIGEGASSKVYKGILNSNIKVLQWHQNRKRKDCC